MNFSKLILFILLGMIILVGFFVWKTKSQINPVTTQQEFLKIVSTNPNPLDEATILPTQSIEITFSKPIFKSEFKHGLDPEIDHEIEVVSGESKEYGKTMRIVFKKPLEFGSGYTLFILQNTHSEEKLTLEREYQYHFRTVKYNGI